MPPGIAKMRQTEAAARGRQQVATAARAAGAGQAENDSLHARHRKFVQAMKKWADSQAPNGGPAMAALRSALAELDAED